MADIELVGQGGEYDDDPDGMDRAVAYQLGNRFDDYPGASAEFTHTDLEWRFAAPHEASGDFRVKQGACVQLAVEMPYGEAAVRLIEYIAKGCPPL